MPTKKIGDIYDNDTKIWVYEEEKTCLHPEHHPPQFMVFTPGKYIHTCPKCGKVTKFEIYSQGVFI